MHAEVSAIDVRVQLCGQWLNTTGMFIARPALVNTVLFSRTHLHLDWESVALDQKGRQAERKKNDVVSDTLV